MNALAHIRLVGGAWTLVRRYPLENGRAKGRIADASGAIVGAMVIDGFVSSEGLDKVVPVETEIVDNSTSGQTQSAIERIVEATRVLDRTIISDAPTYADAGSALAAFVAWLSTLSDSVTGPVPPDEKVAWLKKEQAARDYKAGSADAAQTAMIEGEADLTGETYAALADKVIAKADLYAQVVTLMVGYRRKAEADLAAATDPLDYATIVDGHKAAIAAAIAAL